MLTPCGYEYALRFRRQAERDGVSVKDAAGAKWFAIDGVDGFCCYLPVGTGWKVRVKSFWVAPEFRGRGVGTAAFRELIEIITALEGVRCIEAISRRWPFYQREGFSRVCLMRSATTEKWKLVKRL